MTSILLAGIFTFDKHILPIIRVHRTYVNVYYYYTHTHMMGSHVVTRYIYLLMFFGGVYVLVMVQIHICACFVGISDVCMQCKVDLGVVLFYTVNCGGRVDEIPHTKV